MKEFTIYLVGETAENALAGMPFDDYKCALNFSLDNPGTVVYSGTVTLDPESLEKC